MTANAKTRAGSRPKALVLTQFYAPEPCAAANRVAALAKALDEAEFDVEIVTGIANFPSGNVQRGDRVLWPKTTYSGSGRIALTRVWTYTSTKLSASTRTLNWLSVALFSSLYVLRPRCHYDIVIATMPPIPLALPAFCALIRHRAKLVVDVRDVFPDVAIKMGYWREGSPVARIVGLVSGTLYRAACVTIAVTDSAREELLARGSGSAKTVVAPNGFDPLVLAKASPYPRCSDEFVAAFVGNMGLATGLDVIIDAAIALREQSNLSFVLAGGGADYERLAKRILVEKLKNVFMLGVVTREEANKLISEADVSLVPLHRSIVDSLPTKLFDALALGCPVICCANGEARTFVERSGGGIVVTPQDGLALANALSFLASTPERGNDLASQGQAYVFEKFDRAKTMRSLANSLMKILED
jgi:colanic acid biosynthesis glycosyl transferase WcaI